MVQKSVWGRVRCHVDVESLMQQQCISNCVPCHHATCDANQDGLHGQSRNLELIPEYATATWALFGNKGNKVLHRKKEMICFTTQKYPKNKKQKSCNKLSFKNDLLKNSFLRNHYHIEWPHKKGSTRSDPVDGAWTFCQVNLVLCGGGCCYILLLQWLYCINDAFAQITNWYLG